MLDEWTVGRAGMLYRDLTPVDLKDQVIASHIRLPFDGEVPDYVHYHKVDLQMIYCIKGRIRVVYEDQGEPFWLERGDCVLQPPEIRHQVLGCTKNAEVIEITSPAEHKTHADPGITLPNTEVKPDRMFGGQRFVLDRAPRGLDPPADVDARCQKFVTNRIAGKSKQGQGNAFTDPEEICIAFARCLRY